MTDSRGPRVKARDNRGKHVQPLIAREGTILSPVEQRRADSNRLIANEGDLCTPILGRDKRKREPGTNECPAAAAAAAATPRICVKLGGAKKSRAPSTRVVRYRALINSSWRTDWGKIFEENLVHLGIFGLSSFIFSLLMTCKLYACNLGATRVAIYRFLAKNS